MLPRETWAANQKGTRSRVPALGARSRHRDKALTAHADQTRDEPRPAAAEFIPGHGAMIREVDIVAVEAIGNHPVAAGQLDAVKETAGTHANHDDHGPPLA